MKQKRWCFNSFCSNKPLKVSRVQNIWHRVLLFLQKKYFSKHHLLCSTAQKKSGCFFKFLDELSLKSLELIYLPQASNLINTTQCLNFCSWQCTIFLVLCLLSSVMLRVKVRRRPAIAPAPLALLSFKCRHTSLLESNRFFNYSAIS